MNNRLPDMSQMFKMGGGGERPGAPGNAGGSQQMSSLFPQMSGMLGGGLRGMTGGGPIMGMHQAQQCNGQSFKATPMPRPPVITYFAPIRPNETEKFADALKEPCCICLTELDLQDVTDRVISLNKCTHLFHFSCAKQALENRSQCPRCMVWYGAALGNQPHGSTMSVNYVGGRVPGHNDASGFIEIHYSIPSGTQDSTHPRPGKHFHGTHRTAYLPNNRQGQEVLELLRFAFNQRLTFTVGDSVTTGAKDVVTWNGIHHKTNMGHGPFGYPDPTYLDRVKDELAAYGITVDNMRP